MSHLRAALFASLLFVMGAAAPAGRSGCSCAVPPRTARENPAASALPVPPPLGQAPRIRAAGVIVPVPGVHRSPPPLHTVGTPPPTVERMTYHDVTSGVTLTFETDGQHVSAVDGGGKELWRVNVIETAALKTREVNGQRVWATITSAGPSSPWMVASAAGLGKRGEYISVGTNLKEGGLLDVRTGEYLTMGND